jgi:virulence factor Mce-like protein
MATLALVGVGAALALLYIGYNAPNSIPGRSYYTIRAQFAHADNLANHGQVREDGKLVGQVLNVRVEKGLAVADLQMDPEVQPLLSDSTIEVRPRSPVGVRYVQITPGTHGRPLRQGDMIPASQTKATRQLDEALSTFDPATRLNTQKFLGELGTGFAGRGEDLNATIGASPRFLEDSRDVLGAVADRHGAMRSLIRGGALAAGAADPVRDVIARGFDPEDRALRPFWQESGAVHATLEQAPQALATVRSGLARTDPFVDQVVGLSAELRRALRRAPAAFGQAEALLQESRPGLRAARETLTLAGRSVDPTLRLLSSVRPALPDLDATLTGTSPIVASLGVYGCDILAFGRNWTSMQEYGNQDGGVLRYNLQGGPESAFGVPPRGAQGTNNTYPAPCEAGHETGGG